MALPSLEIIVILVFFLSFILWAVSKCGATKNDYANETENSTVDEENTDSIYFSMPKPLPPKEEPIVDIATPSVTTTQSGNQTVRTEVVSRLYITIDGMNMRTGPHLDSTVIQKFKLFDEVYYMGEETDSTQQINLGKSMVDEPWIKVKNKKGKIGWIYGAGVDYKRKKREGVQ